MTEDTPSALADRLPTGIHFRPSETPPDHWRLLVLDTVPGSSAPQVELSLARVWFLLQDLSRGHVADLARIDDDEQDLRVPDGRLSVVLGYGAAIFASGMPLDPRLRPAHLLDLPDQFPSLDWDGNRDNNGGAGTICLQLTADTELACARAIQEIDTLIRSSRLPLRLKSVFAGFHRDDRRSWLGFHDGINNLSRADRFHALRAEADPAAPWMDTGTYMVFLKLAVDLDLWRSLDRATQEAIVGRKKLSGVPLTSIRQTGLGFQAEGDPVCPFHPLGPRPDPATMECVDPRFGDARTLASHVFRSNLSRGPANLDAANRFYRQGYEFLDIDASGAVTVGLNFVGFTGHPARILRILQDRDWLGDVNFGGGIGGVPAPRLMRLLAGGIFATPALPKDPLRFPGQEIFDEAPFADALLS